jgi:hypothetical protein
MPKNNINDLRKHLFETLASLRDTGKPMEIDRARAVAEVAKVIVESAKVEVDFLKVRGQVNSTGFIQDDDEDATARLEQRSPLSVARR